MNLPQIGLGCMSLSHACGVPPSTEAGLVFLRAALDAGVGMLDTATLYGGGRNEELIGQALAGRRDEVLLASKCGLAIVDGVKRIDGRPDTVRAQVDASLGRLGVDHIDLYYLHRWDKQVPIAESVGALAEAQAEVRIAAVQNEYSMWSRNPELGMLEATRETGVVLVAFSPLARGFLSDGVSDPTDFAAKDIRVNMPRFQPAHWAANKKLLPKWQALADKAGCTPGQLALAWVISRGSNVVPIPGTTNLEHFRENQASVDVVADAELLARAEDLINTATISGPRYSPAAAAEVDAETFEGAAL